MEVDGAVSVFGVRDSMEQFQKFGETLVPIMNKLGADAGQRQIMMALVWPTPSAFADSIRSFREA